jgi:methyltransferase
MSVSPVYAILGAVALQRVAETVYARRNTRALLRRGAVEVAPEQYPFFIALHASWLGAMAISVPPDARVNWPLVGAYALLQLGRLWVFATLRERWTTRVIVLPGAPLVRGGPYRWLRHPNYAIVVAEIALLPCALRAYGVALLFSALNAALLWWRLRAEEAALSRA